MHIKNSEKGLTWVIGAEGMLGFAVLKTLKERQEPFVATGRSVDISNIAQLEQFILKLPSPPTWVINCAAYTAVDRAEQEEELAYAVNAVGPELLGRLARKYGFRVLHVSTDYIFGGRASSGLSEMALPCPANVYARSKLEGEQRLLANVPDATIVRTSWLFGPSGGNFVMKILNAMTLRETIHVVHDQEGRPTFTLDLAHVMVGLRDQPGVYHYANSGSTSWHGFAFEIWQRAQSLGIPIKCREVQAIPSSEFPMIAKRPSYSVLDTSKVEGMGFIPRSWQQALLEFMQSVEPHAPPT